MSADLPTLCDAIMESQVERKFVISLEVKNLNTAAARVVRGLGVTNDSGESDRERAWTRSLSIVRKAVGDKPLSDEDMEVAEPLTETLGMIRATLDPIMKRRDQVEEAMAGLAEKLPAFDLTERVKGFKALGLAVIVGEAGNLSNYATVRKLWRRLGLGMAPGHEERAYSTWKRVGGLTSEDWVRAGYAPRRLAQIYGVVTTPLFMQKAKNPYGAVYDARRERTMITHPEWYQDKNGKPKLNAKGEPSSAHAMEDAKRVMTKALISDLWSEWRRSSVSMEAGIDVAAAT